MDRRAFLAAVSTATAYSASGCLGAVDLPDGGLSENDFDIGMSANAYLPESHEVSVGETVVWGNNGSRGHTVTAYEDGIPDAADFFASGGFDAETPARESWEDAGAGTISPGETFSHTFEVAGQHPYFCVPHEPKGMAGTVIVTE